MHFKVQQIIFYQTILHCSQQETHGVESKEEPALPTQTQQTNQTPPTSTPPNLLLHEPGIKRLVYNKSSLIDQLFLFARYEKKKDSGKYIQT